MVVIRKMTYATLNHLRMLCLNVCTMRKYDLVVLNQTFILTCKNLAVHLLRYWPYSNYWLWSLTIIDSWMSAAIRLSYIHYSQKAQSALFVTPWQTCSIRLHIDFSGKHFATVKLLHEDCSCIHTYHRLQPMGISSLCWMNWSNVEWTNLPKARHGSPGFESVFC